MKGRTLSRCASAAIPGYRSLRWLSGRSSTAARCSQLAILACWVTPLPPVNGVLQLAGVSRPAQRLVHTQLEAIAEGKRHAARHGRTHPHHRRASVKFDAPCKVLSGEVLQVAYASSIAARASDTSRPASSIAACALDAARSASRSSTSSRMAWCRHVSDCWYCSHHTNSRAAMGIARLKNAKCFMEVPPEIHLSTPNRLSR